MTQPQQPQSVQFEVNLPPELEAGTYASFANIWQDNDGFILDFAVNSHPPDITADEGGGLSVVVHARVVSRVRIPYSQAWEFMKGLTAQLGQYERQRGIQPHEDGGNAGS